jgi:uncharacterized protein (UPF0332 family)
MGEPGRIYLAKVEEGLLGAESEFAQGRYNNSANRCYYACFQAAIAALYDADIRPRSGASAWSHTFVQAEFVGRLINQRKLYPVQLRQVLARHLTLRHTADYAPDMVTQAQAARALQRSRAFLDAVQKKVNMHAR